MAHKNNNLAQLLAYYFKHADKSQKTFACPDEEVLSDYLQGALEDSVKNDVELHLSQCPRCLDTVLSALDSFEEELIPKDYTVPYGVRKRVLTLVPSDRKKLLIAMWETVRQAGASLHKSFLSIVLPKQQEEFVYVRGSQQVISQNLVVLERVFKDIKLDIEIENIGSNASDIKVTASHPDSGSPLHGVRLNLCNNDREIASFIAFQGEALFERITFGNYRLMAWQNNRKIGEVLLNIKE